MSEPLDADYYLNEFNHKIIRQLHEDVCQKIKRQVIRALQKNENVILGNGLLKNMWDEICIILQDGDDSLYCECVDTIDAAIELALEKSRMPSWQLCAMWLCTNEGSEWILDKKDKVPDDIYFTHNFTDIVSNIREDYIEDAAMNWTNGRIERFQQSGYEMDDY